MPRLIETDASDSIELGDLVELLETGGFDPHDEDSLAACGPALKRLANNRRFLGDLVIEELKQRCAGQLARNQYSAQVILLHGTSKKFLLRAVFWPAQEDSVVVNSGTDPFFYGVPHDHNFTFLTAGYVGPGYWSDYFEYDYERVLGFTGEKVDLRFVERSRLSEGKLLLYRKGRDVHLQHPPDALSVSLNILAVSPGSEFQDQYRFDTIGREVRAILNASALETLVTLAGRVGGGNGRDLVDSFAQSHPSERIRLAALKAQAAAAPGVAGRLEVYEKAASRGSGFLAAMAAHEARRIESSRAWIEGGAASVRPTTL